MPSMLKAAVVAAGVLAAATGRAQTVAVPPPAPPPAVAPAPPPAVAADLTAHRHLGFFLRLDLGFGFMSSTESTAAGDMTISGGAAAFGVAVGGAIAENLILSAHLYDTAAANPNVSYSSLGSVSSTNTTLSMFGIGPELTYYFMPANVYLSGTLAITRVSLTTNGLTGNTDAGIGLRLAVGKEWWVSDHWGLGVAGILDVGSNQDAGQTLRTFAAVLAFSATYN